MMLGTLLRQFELHPELEDLRLVQLQRIFMRRNHKSQLKVTRMNQRLIHPLMIILPGSDNLPESSISALGTTRLVVRNHTTSMLVAAEVTECLIAHCSTTDQLQLPINRLIVLQELNSTPTQLRYRLVPLLHNDILQVSLCQGNRPESLLRPLDWWLRVDLSLQKYLQPRLKLQVRTVSRQQMLATGFHQNGMLQSTTS